MKSFDREHLLHELVVAQQGFHRISAIRLCDGVNEMFA